MRIAVSGAAQTGTWTTEDERIQEVVWSGAGCSISMASASVLSDSVHGTNPRESRAQFDAFREMLRSRGKIEPDEETMGDAAAFAGVSRYPARVKCAMLPWVAFEAALIQTESRGDDDLGGEGA